MKTLSFCLIGLIFGFVLANGGMTLAQAVKKDNNLQSIEEAAYVCSPVFQKESQRKVVLRVDDIQANAYGEVSTKMIEDAALRNMKLVLGVIPYNFEKDKFITKTIAKNICNLELAVHGWDHGKYQSGEGYEFEDISEEEAREKIKKSEAILQKISKEWPVTFIPPGNKISEGAEKALRAEGVKYLSADYGSSEYGMTATTYNFTEKKLIENKEILESCEANFSQGKNCVIVIHPQDYLSGEQIDPQKYAEYLNLLDELRKRDVLSVTFSDLSGRMSPERPISL